MKRLVMIAAMLVLVLGLVSCAKNQGDSQLAEPVKELNTLQEKYAYVTGLGLGEHVARLDLDLDENIVIQGMRDRWADGETLVTVGERDSLLQQLAMELQSREAEKAGRAADDNKADGEAFLARNATEEGVVVTASGLQYTVLVQGDGSTPTAENRVSVHYRGTLINGQEFDSSYSRGEPATFPVNGVISGWIEGLQLMNVGSKYKFFIPSGLAYGETGAPRAGIGPNSALIFEVELLEIIDSQ